MALAISSAVGEVADKLGDKVKIGKINIDNEIALTTRYTVTLVPTILLFKDGEQVNRISGNVTGEQLKELTLAYLKGEN